MLLYILNRIFWYNQESLYYWIILPIDIILMKKAALQICERPIEAYRYGYVTAFRPSLLNTILILSIFTAIAKVEEVSQSTQMGGDCSSAVDDGPLQAGGRTRGWKPSTNSVVFGSCMDFNKIDSFTLRRVHPPRPLTHHWGLYPMPQRWLHRSSLSLCCH